MTQNSNLRAIPELTLNLSLQVLQAWISRRSKPREPIKHLNTYYASILRPGRDTVWQSQDVLRKPLEGLVIAHPILHADHEDFHLTLSLEALLGALAASEVLLKR